LLAPKSGAETRKDLKRFASSTGEQVVSAVDKGKNIFEAGKGAITAAAESGNIEYVDGKEKFEHAV
jgi:gas vesicle protein